MRTERNENKKIEYVTGEKSRVEQVVNAVKEGFKGQTRVLSNTARGNNQEHRAPIDQAYNMTTNQMERILSPSQKAFIQAQEMQRIQSFLSMQWAQNFPQIMLPANMHTMNQIIQPNVDNTRQNLGQRL